MGAHIFVRNTAPAMFSSQTLQAESPIIFAHYFASNFTVNLISASWRPLVLPRVDSFRFPALLDSAPNTFSSSDGPCPSNNAGSRDV